MARYGVAEAKDRLSELLDAAQAGEEVVITRHGRPAARLVAPDGGVAAPDAGWAARRDAMLDHLRAMRATMPQSPINSVDLIRQMRDEGP